MIESDKLAAILPPKRAKQAHVLKFTNDVDIKDL